MLVSAGRWMLRRGAPDHRHLSIGLALGGGFARGIAHVGVLRVFEERGIPIHAITGVSAGAIVAAAFASGMDTHEIEKLAGSMRFSDVARWTLSRLGLVTSERMASFLKKLLRVHTFEQMRIPLGVVATDLRSGEAVLFRDRGDVIAPIRASCSYPGLFLPVPIDGRMLVDGAMSQDVPTVSTRSMGARRVISVSLEAPSSVEDPKNMMHVVNRCFQILQKQTELDWRRRSDLVIEPDVSGFDWDGFSDTGALIAAGRRAAEEAMPEIERWLGKAAEPVRVTAR